MMDYLEQEEIRAAIEEAGGIVEVVRDYNEPDMWYPPEDKPYLDIVFIHFQDMHVKENLFAMLSQLPQLKTLHLERVCCEEQNFKYLSNNSSLLHCCFQESNITDVGASLIPCIKSLNSVSLSGNIKVTDKGTQHFSELKKLDYLSLCGTSVSSETLCSLDGLNKLDTLLLENTRVGDRGVEALAEICLPLQNLSLNNTQVSNASASAISTFKNLFELYLGYLPIDDHFFRMISFLPGLEKLNVMGTRITDAGVSFLLSHESLDYLDLSNTAITDACISVLVQLKRLKILNINNTNISPFGIKRIQNELGRYGVMIID